MTPDGGPHPPREGADRRLRSPDFAVGSTDAL